MKTTVFLVALCILSGAVFGQVHGGLQAGVYNSTLAGEFTSPQGRTSYSAGIWMQRDFVPWFGLKADILYMPRGGRLFEQNLEADFISLGITPRFRVKDLSSEVNLLVGVGPFTHFGLESEDLFNKSEIGPQFEIGAEWGRVSLVFSGQIGLLDAIPDLPKHQRWVSIGLALQGRIF
jgi:hypothetical protein